MVSASTLLDESTSLHVALVAEQQAWAGAADTAAAAVAETSTGSARATAVDASVVAQAWVRLAQVLDPEMPYVSIVDLGIVRAVVETQEALEVTLTPTFSACPAMEQMQSEAVHALQSLTNKSITVKQKLSPAWSSDWISPAGQAKLLAAGIVPPAKRQECRDSQNSNETVGIQAVHFHPRLNCPRCASKQSELLSAFSSTSCKALYRCTSCLEPFEVIKTI